MARSSAVRSRCKIAFKRSACGTVRGKPSKTKPSAVQAQPVLDQADDDIIGNETAMLRDLGRLHPEGGAEVLSRRRMAPGEVTGIAKCRVIISACVPFPEPGAPRSTSRLFT